MVTGKLYVYLKWAAQIFLPALGVLYFALTDLLGLPATEQIMGTILIIDLGLGVILGISQMHYKKQISSGVMRIDEIGDKITYSLELDEDPVILADKQEVRFKVQPSELIT
jgi:Putative phage holin Dp-1